MNEERWIVPCCSVTKSCPAVCNPMGCSTPGLPPPRACSNSCPLSRWCHPANHLILCHPLLHLHPIFPSIRVFSNESVLRIKWPKYWSFSSVSVLPINIQDWFPWVLVGWFYLLTVKGLSRVFSNTIVEKRQFFGTEPSLRPNSHIHTWLLGKP